MSKERARKFRAFEQARTQIENRIFECSCEAFSHEDIELALEDLVIAIPKLKKFWEENLKEDEDKL